MLAQRKERLTVIFNDNEKPDIDWDDPKTPCELDSHGILAAPGETLSAFAERVEELLRARAVLCANANACGSTPDALEREIGFKVGRVEPMDAEITKEAAAMTERLFGFHADWVPAYFPTRGLGFLWGGCTVITESGVPVFFIRRSFRERGKWFIYRRDELLAHELCHAARGSLEDLTYEEQFAYMTSASAFRRWTGNCFRHEWDALAFLLPVVLLLAVQFLVYAGVLPLPLWPFWLAAFAFPLFLIGRNIPERRTFFRARAKLAANGFARPDAALFRMTSPEIRELSKLGDSDTSAYLKTKEAGELRWQIIIQRFHHQQETEADHGGSTEKRPDTLS